MEKDIGVLAEISSPAKSGVCPPLKIASAVSLAISLGLAMPANEAKAAVTVLPGTTNSTMSGPEVHTFEDDGTGDAGRAEELSTSPGMSKIRIGSSVIGCYQTVSSILISEEDGIAGGTLFLPGYYSLELNPANTGLTESGEAKLMYIVDGAGAITLSQLGKTMQIGFGDSLPVDSNEEFFGSIELLPGAHKIDVINHVYSYRMGTQAESIVQPYFVSNVPEPSSAGLGIGGAAFLLAMRRRRSTVPGNVQDGTN